MQISILSVDVKTVPTVKGSYQTAELAFKNLTFQGKVEGRKIMSFGASASTFKALAAAPAASVWDITVVKNDKGFNDWTLATPAVAGEPAAAPSYSPNPSGVKSAAAAPARSSYETPDERAAKQVYIIRQSNLNAAVAALTPGAKAPLKSGEIFALAKEFENYVLDIPTSGSIKAEARGFDTMQDDSDEVM